MTTVISIIIGIVIFCLIILFHEFGHLLLAKMNGICVPEFTIGFGPRLCGFKIGETEYNIRLILFGGACRMLGEDGDSTDERSFTSKSPWARFSTIVAGPVFNFILAFVLAVVVIGIVGYDPCLVTGVTEGGAAESRLETGDLITSYDGKKITIGRELAIYFSFNDIDDSPVEVGYERDGESYTTTITPELTKTYKLGFYYAADASPASISSVVKGGVLDNAGVKSGDVIVAFNGIPIESGEDFYEYIHENPLDGSEIEFTLDRNGETVTLSLVPEFVESYEIGFNYNYNGRVKTTPIKVLKYAVVEVKYWIVNTIKSLGQIFKGKVSADDFGGPVRIVSELENTVEESKADGVLYVILNLLNWAILLSANLGVMNLLPLPALDGGRLVFILIEAIRGKPVPPEKEGMVHAIGIILLMLLMVFVFFNDIRNVFF